MRKDFVTVKTQAGQGKSEIDFIEDFWTAQWRDRKVTPAQAALSTVKRSDEYRMIEPYLKKLPESAKIVDGGCGLGSWVIALADMGYSAIGVDLSRDTIGRLKQMFPQKDFRVGDIRKLPLEDNSVDAYISWGVFEHFEEGPSACIKEAFRVLKPGGLLFASVPFQNLRHLVNAHGWTGAGSESGKTGERFYQWRFTRAEWQNELERAGFKVDDIRPIEFQTGLERMLESGFRVPPQSKAMGLAVRAAKIVVPKIWVAHMILSVATKR